MKEYGNSEIKNDKNNHESMSIINSFVTTSNKLLVNSFNLEYDNKKQHINQPLDNT
jgi:hypothetical protein